MEKKERRKDKWKEEKGIKQRGKGKKTFKKGKIKGRKEGRKSNKEVNLKDRYKKINQ